MNMSVQELSVWQEAIAHSKEAFKKINEINNFVSYESESMFATQLISKNDYLVNIANNNPKSLRDAVINIASIGLSLNPATKYAYLVPRDNAACLDISYIGLIKLATDTGSILWARAEMVHENDEFIYHGTAEKPEFSTPDPFDRGTIKGVYCVAKTAQGDFLSGVMSLKEIEEIKDRSQAGKKGYGPWMTDFNEMAKKTIIKRESKLWPKTDRSERFDKAVEVVNEHEGIDFPSTDNINYQKVEEAYFQVVSIITNDLDEESEYLKVQNIVHELDMNEEMLLNSKLRRYKPKGGRQYNTLLADYLNYKPTNLIEGENDGK